MEENNKTSISKFANSLFCFGLGILFSMLVFYFSVNSELNKLNVEYDMAIEEIEIKIDDINDDISSIYDNIKEYREKYPFKIGE